MNYAVETDALLQKLASESARQGKNLRTSVRNLTLKALERRELTLEQIRNVLQNVTTGVTLGVAVREIKVEKVLADALAGMDDAMLKVVEASNVALEKLGSTGQDYEDSYLKQALRDLERFEDELLQAVTQGADSAGEKVGAQWARVLHKKRLSGTDTGAEVASVVRDYAKRAQMEMRKQRDTSLKAAHLLTRNFATLASGILIGMSEALEAKGAASKPKSKKTGARTAAKRVTSKAIKKVRTPKKAGPKLAKGPAAGKRTRTTKRAR